MSAPSRPGPAAHPLTVGVIGAGRAGSVIGAGLAAAGHNLVAVAARTATSRNRAAALLPDARVLPAAGVARRATDLLLLAVPDDTLASLAAELAAAGVLRPGQVIAHTSGAHGLGVLRPATARGARPLALHPAMTFTGRAADLDRLPGTRFGVTTGGDLRPLATRLVADLGGAVEWIAEADRPLYHAALAHGANHLVTLVNEAADRLADAGVRQPHQLLAPLLRAALDNALAHGDRTLTGPVARGDAGTIADHLRILALAAPESVDAYRALAHRTADRAIAAGLLEPSAIEALLDALGAPAREPGAVA